MGRFALVNFQKHMFWIFGHLVKSPIPSSPVPFGVILDPCSQTESMKLDGPKKCNPKILNPRVLSILLFGGAEFACSLPSFYCCFLFTPYLCCFKPHLCCWNPNSNLMVLKFKKTTIFFSEVAQPVTESLFCHLWILRFWCCGSKDLPHCSGTRCGGQSNFTKAGGSA